MAAEEADGPGRCRTIRRGAFSVLELLIAVSIVAVLVGLALPALASSRRLGWRNQCATNLASHARVTAAYALDFGDCFPYLLRRDRGRTREFVAPGGAIEKLHGDASPLVVHLASAGLWHVPVIDAYGGNVFHRSLLCPADSEFLRLVGPDAAAPPRLATLRYHLSSAMLLHPAALDPAAPDVDNPAFWSVRRQSEVEFPAAKALVFEIVPSHERWYHGAGALRPSPYRLSVAAADGSSRWIDNGDATPGIPVRLFGTPARPLDARDFAFAFTPWGVRGSDW